VAIESDKDVWGALPHPKTFIPVKAAFYRPCQSAEGFRLAQEGDTVFVDFGRHYLLLSI